MDSDPRATEQIECACGCGTLIYRWTRRSRNEWRERKFLRGHNNRKRHLQPADEKILCGCGCGTLIDRWVFNKGWREKRYVNGHSQAKGLLRFSKEELLELLEVRSLQQLAKELGVSPSSLRGVCRSKGIKSRPRSRVNQATWDRRKAQRRERWLDTPIGKTLEFRLAETVIALGLSEEHEAIRQQIAAAWTDEERERRFVGEAAVPWQVPFGKTP